MAVALDLAVALVVARVPVARVPAARVPVAQVTAAVPVDEVVAPHRRRHLAVAPFLLGSRDQITPVDAPVPASATGTHATRTFHHYCLSDMA